MNSETKVLLEMLLLLSGPSQASLSFTISLSFLKLMSIELMMPCNHLILCHPLLLLPSIFPSIRVFPMSQFFTSDGQRIGASTSASVLPMNIQGWFPLGFTGVFSLLSKWLSRVFSSTTIWKHQFFGTKPSLWINCHLRIAWKNHSFDYIDFCQQSDVSVFFLFFNIAKVVEFIISHKLYGI